MPVGHPLLTVCLFTAAIAKSFEDPPSGKVLIMFDEVRFPELIR